MGVQQLRCRAVKFAIAVCAATATIGATVAVAATLVYFEGVAVSAPGGPESPTRPLAESSVRHLGGGPVCTNAKNLDGNPVGSSYCTSGGGAIAHPYCGCVERRGWAHSEIPIAAFLGNLRARVDW